MQELEGVNRVSITDHSAKEKTAHILQQLLLPFHPIHELVCICIGTDRSTGDSLGPMVGTLLTRNRLTNCTVYGTLDQPVHALNLEGTLKEIKRKHIDATYLAIDACLGKARSVGQLQIGKGPIRPGAAVNKNLPAVGELHITGIVNIAGYMEFFVLQNTRLSMVLQMAEIISGAIQLTLSSTVQFDNQIETSIDQTSIQQPLSTQFD
ncbi:putative sporulation protein YyaC [Seinonella peptonophila]|uniref:Putative sporulation protein YyaC n=1 Tax=Seinonella peptonophila TaxID=112248 RepID=A0A1M4WYC9_9BACL|nr:spore protease YyaC [Seinonella peptonophila]SHE86200.1 putative sporulation protein YyaC [Seinonella peptonophila]